MSLYSDGKAIDVRATGPVTKDEVVVIDGFHGVAMTDAVSGDELAIEVALREHTANVGGSLAVAKGDLLYKTSAGAWSKTATNNRLVAKATSAKDANNVITFVLLPQSA